MAVIPLNIDFNPSDFNSELVEATADGIKSIKWELLNLEILFSESNKKYSWPSIDDIEKHTPSFKFYERFGYTIDKFSEFLIIAEDWEYAPNICINVGTGIEISVGDLTPIGCYIFDIYRDNNYHPEFEFCKSIRIYGCDSENVELYLLNALNKLKDELKFTFSFVSLDIPDNDWEENENEYEIKDEINLLPNLDLITNRLFYKGLEETDKSNSFLDFYRILEYYTVIIMENEIDKIRNNPGVSKRDFVVELNKRMNDNERAFLGRLIKKVADVKLLNFCEKNNIIDKSKADLLSNNLYDFRNSLVHAKSNQKLLPYSKSIFIRDEGLDNWTYVCKELAKSAMRKI
jgi:hypothetical protein